MWTLYYRFRGWLACVWGEPHDCDGWPNHGIPCPGEAWRRNIRRAY